ncbi:MAG: PKD domain-containing protein, partial [Bacteroidota bacterium]
DNPSSSVQNPSVITYNTAGTWDVELTVSDGTNQNTMLKQNYITVTPPTTLWSDFHASATTIIAGQTIDFFDDSYNGPATSWTWTFQGAAATTSSDQNPVGILYDVPGVYDVTLLIGDGSTTHSTTKSGYITVIDPSYLPVADFSSDFTTVFVGGSVDFFDETTGGPIAWEWTFTGASTTSSTDQDPSGIIYPTVGVYPVTLIATSLIGTDTITKVDYITVIDGSSLGPLESDFQATTNRLIIMGQTVSFEDLSDGFPLNWNWQFPGGTPSSSSDQHPHGILYANPGFYDVMLIISNGMYTDTLVKPDYIVVTSELWPDPDGFCDTISNISSNDFPLGFRHLTPAKWGYFPGHNEYLVKAYAEKFTNYTYNHVQGLIVPVVKAYAAGPTAKVRFTVWDVDTTGMPGTVLEYKDVPVGSFTPYLYHSVIFNNPVPVNGTFFVGFQLYYNALQDTFAVYMAPNRGIGGTNTLYAKKTTWKTPSQILGDTLNTSMGIDLVGCLVHVDEIIPELDIVIYPNPAGEYLTVEAEYLPEEIKLEIFDLFGREMKVSSERTGEGRIDMNVSGLSPGVYLIRIGEGQWQISKKITIIH